MAVALVATACDDDGGDDAMPAEDGGEETMIVVGAESLPETLNAMHLDGATSWTVWATGPVLASGYRVVPDFEYEPWIFDGDCTVEVEEPFTVSCGIRDEAAWSDGTEITADDFRFTFQTLLDEANEVAVPPGFERIADFVVTDEKAFSMTFDEAYPAYRDMWATGVMLLPTHVLEGEDFNTVWNSCICDPESGEPIGSGPYLVEDFEPGEQLTLVSNGEYWDGEARTDRVVFISTPETESQVNALDVGEVDVIFPQESIDLRQRLDATEDVVIQTAIGLSLEQLGLLTTVPGLDDLEVRRAIATALPRQDVVATVAQPVSDEVVVLDNSIYMTNQAEYVPNWDVFPADGDLEEAEAILDAAGWTRDGDGVRSRDGVELRFTIGTTAGVQGRELAQQIMQEQLAEIGIAIEIENAPSDDFFALLEAHEYPMALFGWDFTPDPIWANEAYDTDGSLNDTLQSNEQVDALLAEASTTIDPDARAALLNSADRIMATEVVAVIPLYQKPALLAYRDVMSGLVVNATLQGFTWNIEDWERTG